MKTSFAFRFWAPAILVGAASFAPLAAPAGGQTQPAATQAVLDKAHALEVRGRMDLATQFWQQVLLADPNNTEALGGLARAAKLGGNPELAQKYIERLRNINPNDPGIARVEQMGAQADHNTQLQQAGRFAQQGQYAQSMNLYRQVYGDQPPPGDQALAYYETEAATEDGRPHAIAGLRSLSTRFPSDASYQVALGRILTYNPRTRAEGRKLLSLHPADPQAVEALRQSLVWDSQNPATAGDIRAYLARHPDAQLDQALRSLPRNAGQARSAGPQAASQTAEQRATATAAASRNAEDAAAYRALNAKHLDEAEKRFKDVLTRTPEDANALAGMGYIRMQQANFGGALSFLTQARQDGSKDPGLDAALATSRFWYTMGEGAIALNENDLPLAQKQYRAALAIRPASPEALEGLGGTLLKAQQPEAAVPVFVAFIKVKAAAAHAWRGLFLAQYGTGDTVHALQTDRQLPPAVRAELNQDPLYLRALASAYFSAGRDAEAQRVLKSALDLPYPEAAAGEEAETRLQYAGLLAQANRNEQAAGLYREVLARDQNNTAAWQGLVRVEHAMNNDEEALQTLESMPPASYALALRDPGFEQTVASIYQTGKRLDVAQEILEKAIAQQTTAGQKPSVAVQVQLAGIYLERNEPAEAYPLYQQILAQNPGRPEAWKGLLSALHTTGRDSEALAEVQQIPPATRAQLENDVEYLQTVGAVYNALGMPLQSQQFLRRVQQHYAAQNVAPPGDIDIQNAWLLYNGMNDQGLYRQLLMLGARADLTDPQRRTVQLIWANYAVRRANQAADAGNTQKARAILNATASAFGDNPDVIKTLAGGYARAGLAKQAVVIWKSEDLKTASAADYKAAIGSALAAGDQKNAEIWLRFGLDQYPKDPEILVLAARFEQARGDNNRAADYFKASLAALPPPDPGAELATELARPAAAIAPARRRPPADLAALLTPAKAEPRVGQTEPQPEPVPGRPYLPGSGAGTAPILFGPDTSFGPANDGRPFSPAPLSSAPVSQVPGTSQIPGATLQSPARLQAPSQITSPGGDTQLPANGSSAPAPGRRVGDYEPHSMLLTPTPTGPSIGTPAPHASPAEAVFEHTAGNPPAFLPAVYHPHAGARYTVASYEPPASRLLQSEPEQQPRQQQATPASTAPPGLDKPGPLSTQPSSAVPAQTQSAQTQSAQTKSTQTPAPAFAAQEVYGPYVPYHAPAATPVQLGSTPTVNTPKQPEVTDVLPTAHYVPNAKTRSTATRPDVAAANAAAARKRQAAPPRSGESRPPLEDYNTSAPTEGVQYNPARQATRSANQNGSPATQPAAPPVYPTNPYQNQVYPPAQTSSSVPRGNTGSNTGSNTDSSTGSNAGSNADSHTDSKGQQYPQPGTVPYVYPRTVARGRARSKTHPPDVAAEPHTAEPPATPPPAYQGLSYPGIGQPLSYQPYPVIGPAYPLGTPPSDADLISHRLPPLRGGYDPAPLAEAPPLTPRQQTERDLATLESSYSGWLGGTASARYRSGQSGLDRLTDLETTFEASIAAGRNFRFTVVPRAVFLNSGALDLTTFAGTTTGVPVLGTFPLNAINQPAQQNTSGVGGELQVVGNRFAVAAGTTPYEFLVQNITGRALYLPNRHITLYFNRDSVTETQLSYAGLRDPGTATAVYGGNIWGGVVATGGGIRFDAGDEHAGFYFTADGSDLTGFHVLENSKFEASAGAYFLAHTFPGYGRLNVGASLFGQHYAHNERGESYGLGGYFSPSAYFLASVPITFNGRYGNNFHYTAAGAVGVQTFQEDSQIFFPLDRALQTAFTSTANGGLPCTTAQIVAGTCASSPRNANTGGNYSINTEGSYRINEHWFGGGFLSANNTNNFNTVTGGFFIRYLFRSQFATDDYPTGLFPVDGFRPLRVP